MSGQIAMGNKALGLIETLGCIGAIEAADVCLKAANVRLIGYETVKGGLVTVEIIGDVGAVKASIEAASSAVERVGRLVSAHVIPRPAEDISRLIGGISEKMAAAGESKRSSGYEAASNIDLYSMKVVELRALARKLEGINMERSRIKFATRKELLEAILEYHERKS